MGKPWFGRLLLIFLCSASILSANWRPGEMRVKLKHVTLETLETLARMGIDVDQIQLPEAFLYVISEELTQLRKMGIEAEIVVPDMSAYVERLRRSSTLAGYHDYPGAVQLADSLSASFPDIFRKVVYGKSVLGHDLFAVKISDRVEVDEPEPEVGFDGCSHGDEIIGGEILVRLMRDLCLQYGRDERVTRLINEREIWIFPFANPDGRQTLTRRNFNNVDLNRDWGYMWDGWGNSPAPYSQPETRALLRWILDHQFVINQSFHAGNKLISFPWSYRPHQSPDHQIIAGLAEGYAKASQYRNLSFGNGYQKLYPINGSAKDSYYGLRGSLGWTMEVAHQKYPDAEGADLLYRRNFPAILHLLEAAGTGLHGQVVDAGTGAGVAALVWVKSADSEFWPVYSDPEVGDFHKILAPGTYRLRVTANGYAPQERRVVVEESGNAPLQIALRPGGRHFAGQVLACRVPGNNYADDGLTYRALGEPDRRSYSLGRNGWIVMDMGKLLPDSPGEDLRIYEGDLTPEAYTVQVASEPFGPWVTVGSGRGTLGFDIAVAEQSAFRYVRIEDLGEDYHGVANAGFDLDAVEGQPLPAAGPFLMATGLTVLDTLSNFNGLWEAGERVELALQIANLGSEACREGVVKIQCASPYITLWQDSARFPEVGGKSRVTAGRIGATAHPGIPAGENVLLRVGIAANGQRWTHTLSLTVRGGARLDVPESLSFEPHFAEFSVEKALAVANSGPDTLKIFRCRTHSEVFTALPPQLIVPPGQQQVLRVAFHPGAAVTYRDSLEILSNDPRSPRLLIPLTGAGIPAPVIQVPRDTLSLTLSPQDSATVFFTLENNGGSDLRYRFRLVVDSTAWQGRVKPRHLLDADGFHWWMGPPAATETEWGVLPPGAQRLPFAVGQSVATVSLPRPLRLPGRSATELSVSRQGWISFGVIDTIPSLTAVDTAGIPPDVLAPLWGNFASHPASQVWYESAPEKVRIWWRDFFDTGGGGPYNFALSVTPSGGVVFEYFAMAKAPTGFRVGSSGMHFHPAVVGLHAPMRVEIAPRVRIRFSSAAGRVPPGKRHMPAIRIASRDLPAGTYPFVILLKSNDPGAPLQRIPLSLKIVTNLLTGGEKSADPPRTIQLQQNYPNPFNPVTTIAFYLPERTHARLTVYNMLGQLVQTLVDEELPPGEYQVHWRSVSENGQVLPSGLYFYELRTPQFSQIRKMILLR